MITNITSIEQLKQTLPSEFQEILKDANTDKEICTILKQDSQKLVKFIESTNNLLFINENYQTITRSLFKKINKLFEGKKIDEITLEVIYKVIKQYPSETRRFLPDNVTIRARQETFQHNYLHLAAQVPSFREKFDKTAPHLEHVELPVVRILSRFLNEGKFDIGVEPELLLEVIKEARKWKIVNQLFESIDPKMISPSNILIILPDAFESKAMTLINKLIENSDHLPIIYYYAKANKFENVQKLCLNRVKEFPELKEKFLDCSLDKMPDLLAIIRNDLFSLIQKIHATKLDSEALIDQTGKILHFHYQLQNRTLNKDKLKSFVSDFIPFLAGQDSLPSHFLTRLGDKELIFLLESVSHVIKSFDLSRYTDDEVASIFPHLPAELTKLDISQIILDNRMCETLFEKCQGIRHLITNNTLHPMTKEWLSIKGKRKWVSLKNIRNLEVLDISHSTCLFPIHLKSLISHSPQMKIFQARNLVQGAFISIVLKLPEYRSYISASNYCAHLIGQYCHHLKSLDLSHNHFTSEGFSFLVKNKILCQGLEILHLSQTQLEEKDLLQIPEAFPNLRILSLPQKTTRNVLEKMAKHMHQLEELDLSSSRGLTGDDIILLARNYPNLKALKLNDTNVANEHLSQLTEICPKLEILELEGLNITDKGLIPILKNHQFKELNLIGCVFLSDATLEALQGHPLVSLMLSKNKKYTDDAMANLIKTLPHLIYLSLAECPKIGNQTLSIISQCPHLEVLNLRNSFDIGGNLVPDHKTYQDLVKLKKIKKLDIFGTRICVPAVIKLTKALPLIESLSVPYMGDQDILEMLNSIPKIKELQIDPAGIQDSDLLIEKINNTLKCLEKLNLGIQFSSEQRNKIFIDNPRINFIGDMRSNITQQTKILDLKKS